MVIDVILGMELGTFLAGRRKMFATLPIIVVQTVVATREGLRGTSRKGRDGEVNLYYYIVFSPRVIRIE